MGLDMYLTAEKYIHGALDEEPNELTRAVNTVFDTRGYQAKSVRVWATDWRKANQIHNWFVNQIQDGEDDCKEYYVSKESMQRLVDLCKKVLADRSKAEKLLPSQEGFFFGSTKYDEYYFEDLQDTIDKLTPFITDPNWESWDFYYQSSW